MIKKFTKLIRRQLLKIEWIKYRVQMYKFERQKERYHHCWELIMSGQTMRGKDTEKLEPHKTSVVITNDGLIVDYMDGRNVGQKYVSPVYLDSTNWGR